MRILFVGDDLLDGATGFSETSAMQYTSTQYYHSETESILGK
jgi:hypothetical protein